MLRLRSIFVMLTIMSFAGCISPGDSEDNWTQSEGTLDDGAGDMAGPESTEDSLLQAGAASVDELEADLGGPDGVMEFFTTSSEDQIRSVLALYGMKYSVHDVSMALKYIGDCPQYFPSSDRNTWHNFDGEYYYIDGVGRPQQAYKYLPPIVSAPRSESCQTSIGQWGDAENRSNDYDGGHLIGSQVGGWGKRANIVPQDANFNRGNWAQLENAAAKCGGLSSGRLLYQITLGYSKSTTLVPDTFGLYLKDRTQGDSVTLSFTNVDYGGSNGTNERYRGVSFLQANGCN